MAFRGHDEGVVPVLIARHAGARPDATAVIFEDGARDNPLRAVWCTPPPPDPEAFKHRSGISQMKSGFGMTEVGLLLIDHDLPVPPGMVPRYLEVVDELPKTPTNRVKKFELRARGCSPATWDRVAAGMEVKRPKEQTANPERG